MRIDFINPMNGYRERGAYTGASWFWFFLFGPFFLAYKGLWAWFMGACVLAIVSGGVSWFLLPFFTRSIICGHYRRAGWKEI